MDMIDKVSIIVPVYNVSLYLKECIDSIIHQTYPNIEIIIVDDGSCDGSETICDEYSEKYKNIKVIHQKNAGVSVARNTGISKAEGRYICFVDADDYIAPNLCEELVNSIDNDIDLVISGFMADYGQRKKFFGVSEVVNCSLKDLKKNFDHYYKIPLLNSPCAKLYKREIIGELRFDKDMATGEDFLFNLKYYECCKNIRFTPLADYRYNLTNVNSATKKYKQEYFSNQKKCYVEGKKFKYGKVVFTNDALDKTFCSNCINLIQLLCYQKKERDYIKQVMKEICEDDIFQMVCQGKYHFSLNLRIPLMLCKKKRYTELRAFYKIKKALRRLRKP